MFMCHINTQSSGVSVLCASTRLGHIADNVGDIFQNAGRFTLFSNVDSNLAGARIVSSNLTAAYGVVLRLSMSLNS